MRCEAVAAAGGCAEKDKRKRRPRLVRQNGRGENDHRLNDMSQLLWASGQEQFSHLLDNGLGQKRLLEIGGLGINPV